jgi:hypothetical protein
MHAGRTMAAAIATTAAAMLAPGVAQAATVTVKGDDGNPLPIAPGAPPTIRNLDLDVGIVKGVDATRFTVAAAAPDGVPLISDATYCWSLGDLGRDLDYRGNGTYTVVVTEYTGTTPCTTAPLRQTTYQFAVAAGVAIGQPPGPVLIRQKNSVVSNVIELDFAPNPGAFGYDIQYARGGVIGPDGAISGPSASAFVDSATGKVQLRLTEPGNYTMVARANRGAFNTPWSPAIVVRAQAPFDLSRTEFPDDRGPTYSVRGTLGTKGMRGRIKVAIAPGRRGGKFRSLGNAKIRSNGTFTKRFVVRRLGHYRLRYSWKGGALVQKGSVTEGIRIRRRIF